jgi:FixJ family two-component response regulator
MSQKGITDFLNAPFSQDALISALHVLRAFKDCESEEEYFDIQFASWAKLEQLEEFLAYLVDGAPLKDDTIAYIARLKEDT